MTKKAIIMGATSGIGRETAILLMQKGWMVGACGRRTDKLEELRHDYPNNIFTKAIDITQDDAPNKLLSLIDEMGGIDLYLHVSGIGFQNKALDTEIE
ncbi:MAG: SDR family NAD(P)-dependent oxidoreductase, partial [Prevotellaceae bacterium]|nr:SDR family NAD(P)-dependent oxidoreductase [Prevotellaceae bacterium]